jgi:DNA transformation protein and related proteins
LRRRASIADFKRERSGPFTYTRGKKSGRLSEHALPYWRLPDRLYDDPDELALWAECACNRAAAEICTV